MIYVMLSVVIILLVCLVVGMSHVRDALDRVAVRLDELRLSGRTVQRQAVMRNGVVTEERHLSRLARMSKSSRQVFGGDPDSELNRSLAGGQSDDDDS